MRKLQCENRLFGILTAKAQFVQFLNNNHDKLPCPTMASVAQWLKLGARASKVEGSGFEPLVLLQCEEQSHRRETINTMRAENDK